MCVRYVSTDFFCVRYGFFFVFFGSKCPKFRFYVGIESKKPIFVQIVQFSQYFLHHFFGSKCPIFWGHRVQKPDFCPNCPIFYYICSSFYAYVTDFFLFFSGFFLSLLLFYNESYYTGYGMVRLRPSYYI